MLMRVVHLDAGRAWRGGQRQSLILHRRLVERGVDSHLLSEIGGEQYKHAKSLAVSFVYGIPFPKGPLQRQELKKKLHELSPDVIHCHDSRSMGAVPLSRTYRILETRRVSYPIKWISRWRKYRKANFHVGVSREIESYLKHYFNNVGFVSSCTEIEKLPDDCHSPLQQSANHNILFVGALDNQKGVDILVRAFAGILKQFPDSLLHIVGTGSLLKPLLCLTADLELSRHVIFYGERQRVTAFYRFCTVLAVPSVAGEGSSGVIREGLACAIPVIASDLTANREIIDENQTGYFSITGDVDSLEKRLIEFLRGDLPFDPRAALRRAADFSCARMTDKYVSIYKHILKRQ